MVVYERGDLVKQPTKKKGAVFYEETSWFHRVKLLQPDGSVKYSKRGGFQSEAEAEASYYKYEEEFKKASRVYQMSAKPNADVDLKDYLLYWFEDVFSQRIENTTRMVCAYVLYDLILPNMQQDIKLRYANEEYFDSLYADNRGIIADGVPEIEEYMKEVLPNPEETEIFKKELLEIVVDVTEFLPDAV